MKHKTLLFRLFALVAAMMCALGASAAEAYANYTSSNTTLTFYYDNYRSSRTGTTYDLNTGSNAPGWYTDGTYANVTKVVFNSSFASARPTTTYDWFLRMTNLESITGMKSYLNTSAVTNMGSMFNGCSGLTSLDVSGFNTAKVTDMSYLFYHCDVLTSINLTSFNTAKVTDMSFMFFDCYGLTSLNLSSFNTAKVTSMSMMFYNCYGLTTIYAGSGWSTAAVTSSSNMFYFCTSLVGGMGTTYNVNHVNKAYAHIDGGPSNPGYFTDPNALVAYVCYTPDNTTLTFYYDTYRSSHEGKTYNLKTGSNVPTWYTDDTYANVTKVVFNSSFANARPTTTYCWFLRMTNLQSITGINYLNTSEVTDMRSMFQDCNGLTSLDLSGFNTAKVANMNQMFNSCTALTTIFAGSGWSTDAVSSSSAMFTGCTNLVGGQGTTYSSSHTDKAYAHIDGGLSNPGYFTENTPPEAYACYTPSNKTLTFYYDNLRSSRTGTTYDLVTGNYPSWLDISGSVTRVVFNSSFANARPTSTRYWFGEMEDLVSITGMQYLNTSQVTNMSGMFNDCISLTSIDVSHFNTSRVTDMSWMFGGCGVMTDLDVSNFDTSNVTNMRGMFSSCGVTSLDVSDFNTSKVTDMSWMFGGCSNLTRLGVAIDYGAWDSSNVTNMDYMFSDCTSLTLLDLSQFGTSKVTSMNYMFNNCSSLTELDLSTFNTAKVTSMNYMFNNCDGLTELDLEFAGFNTSKVTSMNSMFASCDNLVKIYVGSSWSTAAVTTSNNMFKDSYRLYGGMGTTYDASHVDATYAHIDGGPSNPGYLSMKPDFLRGDVNGDGIVNIADVTSLIDYLLTGSTSSNAGADCNQDGSINIADVTALIDRLLSGSW